jgi:hypothetical protein
VHLGAHQVSKRGKGKARPAPRHDALPLRGAITHSRCNRNCTRPRQGCPHIIRDLQSAPHGPEPGLASWRQSDPPAWRPFQYWPRSHSARQASDGHLFVFYLPLANIDVPEYYSWRTAGKIGRALALVDVAVLRSRNFAATWSGLPSFTPYSATRRHASELFLLDRSLARPQ